ncbi:hypothetical protein PAECIP112173_03595 [Paenibacillus sp. JJ-100]|nr:hypothetical protein PAECIP112173_03595 [Paenibacillus sp. JJ-100]
MGSNKSPATYENMGSGTFVDVSMYAAAFAN